MKGGLEIPLIILRKEMSETWRNKYLLPMFIVLPLIAAGLPVLFTVVAQSFIHGTLEKKDPVMVSVQELVLSLEEFKGMSFEEAATRYLLRNLLAFFLLIPLGLASIAAAFSIVAEKQQRTLEPILATPISDSQFMLGKMLVATVPAMAITWATAIISIVIIDIIGWRRYGTLLLPDRFWVTGIFLLTPLLVVAAVLATMRFSAKMTDPQAANQFTGLVIVPGFVIFVGIFGKALTLSVWMVLGACVVVFLFACWLFRLNLKKFQREEILTRWK